MVVKWSSFVVVSSHWHCINDEATETDGTMEEMAQKLWNTMAEIAGLEWNNLVRSSEVGDQ